MPDIEIIRRRDRCYFFGETNKGKVWIVENLKLTENVYFVDIEHLDDMLRYLKENDITYESK